MITIPLTLSLLYLILLVRLEGYIVNLYTIYFYKFIGKLTEILPLWQGMEMLLDLTCPEKKQVRSGLNCPQPVVRDRRPGLGFCIPEVQVVETSGTITSVKPILRFPERNDEDTVWTRDDVIRPVNRTDV